MYMQKHLDMNCGLLNVRSLAGMPKLLAKCTWKRFATVVVVVFVVGTALVNFYKWSVITTMYWLALFAFVEVPAY